jgi:DNA repair exonuclease SbcCD nuclease subunit
VRIAITADAHLRDGGEHPERYNALENILQQVTTADIEQVIIAGDLFDKDYQNYSEFEQLCAKYGGLELLIIPGNHDPGINENAIVGDNIRIFTEPTIKEINETSFLFIPYRSGTNMGDEIAKKESELSGGDWILVGHGDFGVVRAPISRKEESGTYMPLSRMNLQSFRPRAVFLGHIHKPHSPYEDVHYVGSPCGLDITETGQRSFVIYDTSTGEVQDDCVIETDVLYFNESFQMIPRDNEVELLGEQIQERIQAWKIEPSEYEKVQLRVSASGYAKDRRGVSEALQRGFTDFRYFKDEGPRIDELSVSSDDQLEVISDGTMKLIEELDWPFGGDQPSIEMVESAALKAIYGN